MKNYINILIIALLAVFIISCQKEFLEKEPISQALPEEAQTNAEALLEGAYAGFYSEYYVFDYCINGDVISDNSYAGGDNPANFQIDEFTTNSTNGNIVRDWGYLFEHIKNCNVVIDYVPLIDNDSLDIGNRRNQIIAEAKFLRAFYHFEALRLWGPIPYISRVPATQEEMQPSRLPVDEVYQKIIADLESALPDVRINAPNKGIVTKGAVNAFLARVHAQKPDGDYNKVLEYCDAVISGNYELIDNYSELFDGFHKNSSESILEIQYGGDGTAHSNWIWWIYLGSGWKKFNTPTNDLVKVFEEEGDTVRLNTSILFLDSSAEAWTDEYWDKSHYPYIYKYHNEDGSSNVYMIRLADIILLKAEALNELGYVNDAADLVNQIRARVNLPNTTASTRETMREAILKERRLELAFEGQRWYDLLRAGKAIEVMNAQEDGEGNNLNYNITEDDLIWPISQEELDLNPNMTQN
ncbi:MAG: RagB/SusD family nutrient uptake outer membrane protein [Bacteroidales bacterium]|nr:RagB/SusD family nutrient uptake outer membrane protein [Bacteroidales bacterium]